MEHVELRVSADLSWAPILERLGELRGLRSLQLSPCFSRMNDDVELPSGQHLAAICARMKVCRPPARPGSVRSTGPPGLPGALGSLAWVHSMKSYKETKKNPRCHPSKSTPLRSRVGALTMVCRAAGVGSAHLPWCQARVPYVECVCRLTEWPVRL